MRLPLTNVGVVVPAHNEERLLAQCLDALRVAVSCSPVPVELLVVLDACTDASARICRDHGVPTLRINARNVGLARAAGIAELTTGWSAPAQLWLANTDADSVVPPAWIADQVRVADAGADVVLGLVELDDDGSLTTAERAAFYGAYDGRGKVLTHAHVHGANLGLRATSYLRVGGFQAQTDHEDRDLVRALRAVPEVVVVPSIDLRVLTSSRLEIRCREGFASHLRTLAEL